MSSQECAINKDGLQRQGRTRTDWIIAPDIPQGPVWRALALGWWTDCQWSRGMGEGCVIESVLPLFLQNSCVANRQNGDAWLITSEISRSNFQFVSDEKLIKINVLSNGRESFFQNIECVLSEWRQFSCFPISSPPPPSSAIIMYRWLRYET